MSEKTIKIPIHEIEITLVDRILHSLRPDAWGGGNISSSLHEECPDCGGLSCYGHCENGKEQEDDCFGRAEYNKIMDGIESLILAQACAGINVESLEYIESLQTALDQIGNNC